MCDDRQHSRHAAVAFVVGSCRADRHTVPAYGHAPTAAVIGAPAACMQSQLCSASRRRANHAPAPSPLSAPDDLAEARRGAGGCAAWTGHCLGFDSKPTARPRADDAAPLLRRGWPARCQGKTRHPCRPPFRHTGPAVHPSCGATRAWPSSGKTQASLCASAHACAWLARAPNPPPSPAGLGAHLLPVGLRIRHPRRPSTASLAVGRDGPAEVRGCLRHAGARPRQTRRAKRAALADGSSHSTLLAAAAICSGVLGPWTDTWLDTREPVWLRASPPASSPINR